MSSPKQILPEPNIFSTSVVGVATAIPAFIGYTQQALVDGESAYLKRIPINSLAEYETIFGTDFRPIFDIVPAVDDLDFVVEGKAYRLMQTAQSMFNLYYSLQLFFLNGGGSCYVVSIGDYADGGKQPLGAAKSAEAMIAGLGTLASEAGPTMLAIPDAVLLPVDLPSTQPPTSAAFSRVMQAMLQQCSTLQDRIALLDVYGTQTLAPANLNQQLVPLIESFRNDAVAPELSYGVAYFPFLNAALIGVGSIDFRNFDPRQKATSANLKNATMLQQLLYELSVACPQKSNIDALIASIATVDLNDDAAVQTLNRQLSNALPAYAQWQQLVSQKMNPLPPSGAMAGVITATDQEKGVWNAPANVALASVISLTANLTDSQQAPLNAPLDGKAVNALRMFTGNGILVWGARTLDANSNDWRYVPVRRTCIYIEQSIKNALQQFVFATNDAQTWSAVTAMTANFLKQLWQQGGLIGATARDAISVQCGLGSTMTAQDILNGVLRIEVAIAMVRPAEFILLVLTQQMQTA